MDKDRVAITKRIRHEATAREERTNVQACTLGGSEIGYQRVLGEGLAVLRKPFGLILVVFLLLSGTVTGAGCEAPKPQVQEKRDVYEAQKGSGVIEQSHTHSAGVLGGMSGSGYDLAARHQLELNRMLREQERQRRHQQMIDSTIRQQERLNRMLREQQTRTPPRVETYTPPRIETRPPVTPSYQSPSVPHYQPHVTYQPPRTSIP